MKAIAAMASNRVIGKDGTLPWRIPGDLKFFKKMTAQGTCIVGRSTFETLPHLRNRKFVVATKDENYLSKPFHLNEVVGVCNNLEKAPVYNDDNIWVIGGAIVYRSLLPLCTDLYLTRIFKPYEGDTFFPTFDHLFVQHDIVERTDDYMIIHYKRRNDT